MVIKNYFFLKKIIFMVYGNQKKLKKYTDYDNFSVNFFSSSHYHKLIFLMPSYYHKLSSSIF